MKTTTTEKKKMTAAEKTDAAKPYEDALERKLSSLAKFTLLQAAIGREHRFSASSVDDDKRSAPKKVRDLIARGLIEELPMSEWGEITYRLTEKAVDHAAPPLTTGELHEQMLDTYKRETSQEKVMHHPFHGMWNSLPAIRLSALTSRALRTIILQPNLVIAARCSFNASGPEAFIPHTIGTKQTDLEGVMLSRTRDALTSSDSVLVSCPAVCAHWRVVLTYALRKHVTTSPECTSIVLAEMLKLEEEQADALLGAANCYGPMYTSGESRTLGKNPPGEWVRVVSEHIVHAEKKIASYQKSMNAAATLLSDLERIPDIERAFAEASEFVIAENVKLIP